ncbi:MAG: hypothetical protein ACI87E_003467 [Mariniblastus sp.]|jgi:hypothetical protein
MIRFVGASTATPLAVDVFETTRENTRLVHLHTDVFDGQDMSNFDIKRSSRKCYESEREFQPGETFYSALIEIDEVATERRDFCEEAWEGPPEDCLGWWKSQMPELNTGRVYWAPKHVLLAYFEHVQSNEQTADIAYVTALLLAQKKILVIGDSDDPDLLFMQDKNSKASYEIAVPEISSQRLNEIQNELAERLFMDQPIADGEPENAADHE